ncbi:MAG: response regulator, partial [Candidatus Obscuribacterales bacterium]|nr:response regulator [Candidatus Obscuribacterales bacterium]
MSVKPSKPVIKILIVEDSPLMQQLLTYIFGQDPAFQVIGTADDGPTALEKVKHLQPDVVTMDIQIKRANGLEVTRQIMESTPVPIVVISTSCQPGDTLIALEIMQAGALAAMPKPPAISHHEFQKVAANLRQIVKDMSAVRVVKRRPGGNTVTALPVIPKLKSPETLYNVLAIGASTGGPPAVLALLKELSPKIPLPVLLVQHIYPGFAPGLVEWLSSETPWKVKLIDSNTKAENGYVYLCENGFQMGIKADKTITVSKEVAESRHCPSVSHLFASTASAFGPKSIGIILSGMGNDGAEELKQMRDKGAMTIAQDQKSSIVYGMPGEANKLNAAEYVLSPTATARLINHLFAL